MPKYTYSGDKIEFSNKRDGFNRMKKVETAPNTRYLDIHDRFKNTNVIALDCDSYIPPDFDWQGQEPHSIIQNPVSRHAHLLFTLPSRMDSTTDRYINTGKNVIAHLRDLGLKVEDKLLNRIRSPVFHNLRNRKRSTEIRDGREYAEANYHVVMINPNAEPVKLSRLGRRKPKNLVTHPAWTFLNPPVPSYDVTEDEFFGRKTEYQYTATRRNTINPSDNHRHDFMIEASHDERFTFLRKHGSIDVDDAFGIFKKYSSDLDDSQVMNDAKCFVRWVELRYTRGSLGKGDWYNGMYLNVPLDEMRERGWDNYRDEVGETRLDCSKRTGIPYWKVKELVKQGLMVLCDTIYQSVEVLKEKMSEYRASILSTRSDAISTKSGEGQKTEMVESGVDEMIWSLDGPSMEIFEPPRPPPKEFLETDPFKILAFLER